MIGGLVCRNGSRILVVSSTCMALHGFENREAQSLMVYHHFSHYIKDVNSHFEQGGAPQL